MKSCNLCQGGKLSLWCKKGGFDILECSVCGLIFADLSNGSVHNSEIGSGNDVVYDKSYFDGSREIDFEKEAAFFRTRFNDRLRRLGKYRKGKNSRLLDIGCATGLFLAAAKNQGWDADGVEISEYAASIARNKGFKVYASMDDCRQIAPVYDVVTMWHVLEHMVDPRSVLMQIHGLLKPGGVLAIEVPDAGSKPAMRQKGDWHFVKPPEHIYYFNDVTLNRLLTSLNFHAVESVQLPWGTGVTEKMKNINCDAVAMIKSVVMTIPGVPKLRDWMIRHWADPEVLLIMASKKDSAK